MSRGLAFVIGYAMQVVEALVAAPVATSRITNGRDFAMHRSPSFGVMTAVA
jgi:hypothetical protein